MKLKNYVFALCATATLTMMSGCSNESIKAHGGNLEEIVKSKTLVVGTNAEYAPFEYINTAGKVVGYDIDVVGLIETKIEATYDIDLNVVITDMPFDGLIGSMNSNQIDFIAAAFSKDAEREKTLAFSNIYYKAQTVLVVKDNNTSVTDYDSLSGKKLGAQLGTVQVDFATEATGESNVSAIASLSGLILDLQVGNIDALVVEKPVAQNIVGKNNGFKIIDTIPFADDDGYGFATNKGNDSLIALLNEVIIENQANGKLDEMFASALEESLA